MSLSAYDIFTRLDGFGDEESSTVSSHTEDMEEKVEEDDYEEELVLSSVGSDSFDAISLDSAVLQELERSNQRTGITATTWSHSDGEQTILSSAPSGASIPPPEASRDIYALTPHPHFVADSMRSISTTNTEYFRDTGDDASSVQSLSTINTRNSGETRTMVLRRASPLRHVHEAAVFERISRQLLGGDAVSSALSQASPAHWYNRLVSESDWDQFRVAAKAILGILEPKPSTRLLPLPPTPPETTIRTSYPSMVAYCAEDHLPSDFICGICKDVIVGACTLDCGCDASMVCAICFEQSQDGSPEEAKQDVCDQMGFVWIEDAARECPTCHGKVNTKVHCHALDVAILHIIRDLPDSNERLEGMKHNYYTRLATWRATVYDRNERSNKQITAQHDELLARLIQEEERIFWSPREKGNSSCNGFLFLGQAAVALVAATIASIGFNVISKR
ncbi:hypothetical protein IV203_038145 [Nitzschia inconspicua]|uniref:RING-type domain-containing protein n=1 Tax=Nitzschia inconspicua TaxID=303405 RepID=A0A9K3LMQ2_9STRA|nr:hypothetical protein IV203_038145 [Nitzschia inconspicua]